MQGRENVPKSGPVILAANHRSFLDSVLIPAVIWRRVTFVAKAEYFEDKKTAWFFRSIGQIPIRREGGDASQGAIDSALAVLAGGGVFGIYPEGTRTRDGLMHRGHTGVSRIALRSGAPVVPVGLIGTEQLQPVDSRMPKFFRKVTIKFGEPLDLARYASAESNHLALRDIADEIMFELQQLTGYEYQDSYAGKTPAHKAQDQDGVEGSRLAS